MKWDDFVTLNYLEDFVDENLKPKKFIGEDTIFVQGKYTPEELEEAIKETIRLIIKRGYRINNEKNETLEKKDIDEIKKDILKFMIEMNLEKILQI